MRFGPKEIIDKIGRKVILRNAEVEDAEALIEYLKVTTGETPFLIREPDEVTLSLEKEQNFIKDKIDATRELMLIATIDGNHIGNCSLMTIAPYKRYAHRCDVAISLYKELGFEKCGHFPNNMKYADGKYADGDWMMKKL